MNVMSAKHWKFRIVCGWRLEKMGASYAEPLRPPVVPHMGLRRAGDWGGARV